MSLIFYDFEFNPLLAETKLISSKWTLYYNGIGSFEAHMPLTSEAVKLVSENRYVVAVQNGMAAIVVGAELRDELIVYGRSCNWLLSKRIFPESEAVSGTPPELAAGFVSEAFSDVDNFCVKEFSGGGEIEFESGQALLSNAVADCLAKGSYGHSVEFDAKNKKWVFEVLSGKENDLIMSEANKNASDTVFSVDILNLATCGRYWSEGENGRESVVLDGDTEKTGIYRWEAELAGSSACEAGDSLAKMTENNEITLKARRAYFGQDYSLGDIVRVQIIKGGYRTTVKKRIKGIEIWFEQGMRTEKPIFENV